MLGDHRLPLRNRSEITTQVSTGESHENLSSSGEAFTWTQKKTPHITVFPIRCRVRMRCAEQSYPPTLTLTLSNNLMQYHTRP